jgi:DNA-binding transcriptional LysR family regulator
VELRHFRYFVAVAEELHFRHAAERMHVAQPAISEQIRKFEDELGVRLFDRSPRAVSLTASGAAMLDEARSVLRQSDVAPRVARRARERPATRLRVGYLRDSLPATVPIALRRLSRTNANLDVELESGTPRRMIDALRDGRFDIVIANLPIATDGLRVMSLGHQHAIAAIPPGHPQAFNSTVVLEWATRDRVITLPRETNPAFHGAVVAMCHAAGLSPAFTMADSVEHALLGVAAGAGIALLPEAAAERIVGNGIRFLPLRGAPVAIESVALTAPRAKSPVTEAFLRALRQAAKLRAADDAQAAVGA